LALNWNDINKPLKGVVKSDPSTHGFHRTSKTVLLPPWCTCMSPKYATVIVQNIVTHLYILYKFCWIVVLEILDIF